MTLIIVAAKSALYCVTDFICRISSSLHRVAFKIFLGKNCCRISVLNVNQSLGSSFRLFRIHHHKVAFPFILKIATRSHFSTDKPVLSKYCWRLNNQGSTSCWSPLKGLGNTNLKPFGYSKDCGVGSEVEESSGISGFSIRSKL